PEVMAHRTETPSRGEVLCLHGHDAGSLSPADGEETPRCVSNGREVYVRGSPGNRRRRRYAHGDGARAGGEQRDRGNCRLNLAKRPAAAAVDVGSGRGGSGGQGN